jgi:hypothetical protein
LALDPTAATPVPPFTAPQKSFSALLDVEPLEARNLLALTSHTWASGQLVVTADSGNDTNTVAANGSAVNGTQVGAAGGWYTSGTPLLIFPPASE